MIFSLSIFWLQVHSAIQQAFNDTLLFVSHYGMFCWGHKNESGRKKTDMSIALVDILSRVLAYRNV